MADEVVRDIPEEMVEAALLGAMGYDAVQDDDCPKNDDYFVAQMRAALSAALAGRQVVDLPAPDSVDHAGNPIWHLTEGGSDVTCAVVDGEPFVAAISPCDPADLAEAYGLALIAAARHTRRLAAGSGAGEG